MPNWKQHAKNVVFALRRIHIPAQVIKGAEELAKLAQGKLNHIRLQSDRESLCVSR
jgi:hypothetical protein